MATRNINTFIEHLMNEAMTAAGTAGGGKGGKGGDGNDGGFGSQDFPQYNNPDYGPRPNTLPPLPYDESDPDFVGPPGNLAPRPSMFEPRPGRRPLDGVATPGGNANPNRPGGFRPPMKKPKRPYGPKLFPGKAPRRDPSKPPLPPLGG
jgi:hypothetical protein